MKSAQLTAFVEAIRQSGLLNAAQFASIAASAEPDDADPQVIAKDIVQRGWLTPFQVKMFWKGKGQELLLNQYVIVDRLGEGGMGEVYKARHRRMERDVALKVIRKERLSNPEAIKRFHREIRAAAQLAHENVVMAYDADQAGDRHFFAMEFVEGTNLAQLVKEKGPLPIKDACDYIRQAAMGLQHAFEKGMVHRDIKPSNLLLGKGNGIKILDMGLARLHESPTGEAQSRLTHEGLVIGTPDFLSPEQARNAHTADIRADIYSLGSTLYFLLVGNSPYPVGTPTEKMLKHSTDPIPTVNRPDMPPALEAVLQKMLAKKPKDRYQTPAEVAYALEPFCSSIAPGGSALRPVPIQLQPNPSKSPLAFKDPEPSTDINFRLPPPRPEVHGRKKANPKRWYPQIALGAVGLLVALLGWGIYTLVKSKPSTTKQLEAKLSLTCGIEMVLVKPGTFAMGSEDAEEGHQPDEGPVHEVEISHPFYLGTMEVTVRQYQTVLGRLPKSYLDSLPADKTLSEGELDQPITLNYGEAIAFIAKLNRDDKSGRKSGWEFRLPTEAEWEYACRAGTRTAYHAGDRLTAAEGIFGEAERKKPDTVGQREPNAWGLFDMHGNVAEWCGDRYDENFYSNSPSKDPVGERRAKSVVRGGAWNSLALDCRSAKRRAEYPEKPTVANVGFRVLMVQVSKE